MIASQPAFSLADAFEHDGYFVARGLLTQSELVPVIKAIERAVEAEARKMLENGSIHDTFAQLPFDLRWDMLVSRSGGKQANSGWNASVFGPEIHALLCNPKLHTLLEPLLGPELWANGDFWVRPKRPHEDMTTLPWHQDSTYYMDPTSDVLMPTLWLPLVDVDEINGCLQIIPNSHGWGLQPTVTVEDSWFRVPAVDPTLRGEPIAVPMRAGDVLVFSNLTFHRSLMNTSDHVRWSIDLRYSRTGTWLPWLESHYPGFRARSAVSPEAVECYEAWRRRKAFVDEHKTETV